MSIWRFAAIVATSCVTIVLVAVFGFAIHQGQVDSLLSGGVVEALSMMLVFVALIFTIITFPYYWFRLVRASLQKGTLETVLRTTENAGDVRGMVASAALGLVTLLLGYFVLSGT